LFGLPRSQLQFELLQEPCAGIQGRGRQPAIIKAWPADNLPETAHRDRPGTIGIVEGKVEITSPKGRGMPAKITVTRPLKLFVDGEPIEDFTYLYGPERVRIETPRREPSWEVAVEISPDGMEAYLNVQAQYGHQYEINDQEPTNSLILTATEKSIPPQPYSVDELASLLTEEHVVFGIDMAALVYVSGLTRSERVLVARGLAPEPPEDDRIEYAPCLQQRGISIDPNAQRVDYYEINQTPSVEEGDLLAIRIPGREGTPGRRVTGELIAPRKIKEAKIRAGKGVYLIEGGRVALASINGQPILSGGVLEVLPIFTVPRDADLSTGNIRFAGHVLVKNNVTENVEVEAQGWVKVGGLISRAQVAAGELIECRRSILASLVQAGHAPELPIGVIVHLVQLNQCLRRLQSFVEVLDHRHVTRRKRAKVLALVIKDRLPLLERTMDQLKELLVDIAVDQGILGPEPSELLKFFHSLVTKVDGLLNGQSGIAIRDLINQSDYIIRSLAERVDPADIRAGYVHNSQLEATGKILIRRAAYNSQLTAVDGVYLERASFRGGRITTVNGPVIVKELGTPSETHTRVEIVQDGIVQVGIVHPNVTVMIDGKLYRFLDRETGVTISKDKRQDRLVIKAGGKGRRNLKALA
jgi:hypothetical protein